MNSLTYILISNDVSYLDIVGKVDRRSKDYMDRHVITSWGKRDWTAVFQLTVF